jgi:hypothetical protein
LLIQKSRTNSELAVLPVSIGKFATLKVYDNLLVLSFCSLHVLIF